MNKKRNEAVIRRIILTACSVFILIGTLFVAGCASGSDGPGTGTPVQAPSTIAAIGEILEDPEQYNGTIIAVQGRITLECSSGCWFILDDGTGTIYVTLSQDNFAIPQLQGRTVTAEGKIAISDGDITLRANRVITDSGTYP